MKTILKRYAQAGALICMSVLVVSCGKLTNSAPKDTVIGLFGAMERNDKGGVANALDLAALMQIRDHDYALQVDPPRTWSLPNEIIGDLTDSGRTKTVWFSLQRVIGEEERHGDTAFVEVSFVNKETGVQYYNKFGLHNLEGSWRIFAFKTVVDTASSPES